MFCGILPFFGRIPFFRVFVLKSISEYDIVSNTADSAYVSCFLGEKGG